MRKAAIRIVTVAVMIGSPAFAADMAVKAPPAPVPVYDWTGFYFGGNVGYGWGRAPTDVNVPTIPDLDVVTIGLVTTFIPVPGASFSDPNKMNGINGGVQLGYNAQFGKLVVGVETDWQGVAGHAGATDASSYGTFLAGGPFTFQENGTVSTQYQAKIDWFGTARGRVGYAADQFLFFATGGLAYGRVAVTGTNSFSDTTLICGIGPCFGGASTGATGFGASRTNAGWALGGGVEGAFLPMSRWTWKAEYLHVDLGSLDTTVPPAIGAISFGVPPAVTTHTHFSDDILRVGVNYRFEVPGAR
jgi:outer membrane immunogenic protein